MIWKYRNCCVTIFMPTKMKENLTATLESCFLIGIIMTTHSTRQSQISRAMKQSCVFQIYWLKSCAHFIFIKWSVHIILLRTMPSLICLRHKTVFNKISIDLKKDLLLAGCSNTFLISSREQISIFERKEFLKLF